MQRGVVIVAVGLLVTASLGVGVLTAHWPFWRRAWAWHEAGGSWPESLPGPRAIVQGGAAPLRPEPASGELAATAATAGTQLLLRSRAGHTEAWMAPGFDELTIIDGRGLSVLVLAPLFDALAQRHDGLLDRPVGKWLDAWTQDHRGALTPRELLSRVEKGIATRPQFPALNPFAASAQLASGPDFQQAALAAFNPLAASVPDMQPAAAAQLLAGIAAAVEGAPFVLVLERELWSGTAAQDATLLLDRRRGAAAAHCCLRAAAGDWLRLGLRLAGSPGTADQPARTWKTPGRALLVSASGPAAVLWIGEGEPPSGLEILLSAP
jgi:hypothetical protein